jgi:hypothetical protein
MMMKVSGAIKNGLLIFVLLISQIPSIFIGTEERMNLSIFVERSTRLDFVALYYVNAVDFLILSFCLWKPRGINPNLRFFIFILTVLDLIHLLFLAKQNFGITKMGLTVIIYFIYDTLSNSNNGET